MHFALGQCVARNPTMFLFFLSLYGCGQVIQLNDFVWCSLAFFVNVVVGFPRRCRKKCIPQLIARVGYRLTKNYVGYPKRYTKLRLTPIFNCTYIWVSSEV